MAASASGVCFSRAAISIPWLSSLSRTFGLAREATTDRLRIFTISLGVPFGAYRPAHNENSRPPWYPASAIVGTSGRIFRRWALVTPRALIAPERTWGAAVAGLRNAIWI